MTHHNVFYYGGRYPVQTNLVSPKQASTSTDLRDETGDGSGFDCRNQAFSNTYDMASYHQSRLHSLFSFGEDLAPSVSGSSGVSGCSNSNYKMSQNREFDSSSQESSNQSSSSVTRSDDSDMEFEVYQSSASLLKNSFAPCPLQVPLDESCFYPRATSTPTMSPENSSSSSFKSCLSKPDRSSPRKCIKRKLRFASEDEEAVYYLQTKYLHKETNWFFFLLILYFL